MSERQFVMLLPGDTAAGSLRVLSVPDGPSSPMGDGVILEPVELQRRPYLLMLHGSDHDQQVRHNGQVAWPVTLLRVKDEVRTAAGTFFVSSQRGESVFPPQEHHLGAKCPLCTLAITQETLLFACGSCGALLHCEDDRWPEDERLECARLASSCPNCQQAIDFGTGLEWEPEL